MHANELEVAHPKNQSIAPRLPRDQRLPQVEAIHSRPEPLKSRGGQSSVSQGLVRDAVGGLGCVVAVALRDRAIRTSRRVHLKRRPSEDEAPASEAIKQQRLKSRVARIETSAHLGAAASSRPSGTHRASRLLTAAMRPPPQLWRLLALATCAAALLLLGGGGRAQAQISNNTAAGGGDNQQINNGQAVTHSTGNATAEIASNKGAQAASTAAEVLDLSAFEAARLGYFRHSIPISVILTIAYTIVFVIGIVGNSFVVAIVCKSPRMRTVTNYFIANLALADILVLLLCLPATLVGNLFVPYVLGQFVCKTVSYLQGVAVSASINTMVTVTMDRFLAICFPLDWHMSRRTARWVIACIWLFSLSISLPWALYFTLVPYDTDDVTIQVCAEQWPNEQMGTIYFVCANLILLYLFPATVIILCYLGIWYKIERRNIPGDRVKGLKIELIMQKSKLKVVKMMMVVVVIFLLSWLPLYLIFARLKLAEEPAPWEEWLIPKVMPLAQWLGASNSCINPILYTFFNRKYKRGFVDLLRFAFCCKPLMKSSLTEVANGRAHNYAATNSASSGHASRQNGYSMAALKKMSNAAAAGKLGGRSTTTSIGLASTSNVYRSSRFSQHPPNHRQQQHRYKQVAATAAGVKRRSNLWTRDMTLIEQNSNDSSATTAAGVQGQRAPCNCSGRQRNRPVSTNQRTGRRHLSPSALAGSASSPGSFAHHTPYGHASRRGMRKLQRRRRSSSGQLGPGPSAGAELRLVSTLAREPLQRCTGSGSGVCTDIKTSSKASAANADDGPGRAAGSGLAPDGSGQTVAARAAPTTSAINHCGPPEWRATKASLPGKSCDNANIFSRSSDEATETCQGQLDLDSRGGEFNLTSRSGTMSASCLEEIPVDPVAATPDGADWGKSRGCTPSISAAARDRRRPALQVGSAKPPGQHRRSSGGGGANQNGRSLKSNTSTNTTRDTTTTESTDLTGLSITTRAASSVHTDSVDSSMLQFAAVLARRELELASATSDKLSGDGSISSASLGDGSTENSMSMGSAADEEVHSMDEMKDAGAGDGDDGDSDALHDVNCCRFKRRVATSLKLEQNDDQEQEDEQEFVSDGEEDDEDMLFGSADNSPIGRARRANSSHRLRRLDAGSSRPGASQRERPGVELGGYQVAIRSLATSGTSLANLAMQKLSSSCKFRPVILTGRRRTASGGATAPATATTASCMKLNCNNAKCANSSATPDGGCDDQQAGPHDQGRGFPRTSEVGLLPAEVSMRPDVAYEIKACESPGDEPAAEEMQNEFCARRERTTTMTVLMNKSNVTMAVNNDSGRNSDPGAGGQLQRQSDK